MSQTKSPKSQRSAGHASTSASAPPDIDPAVTQLEERFRALSEATAGSLRDQTTAFESVVQMALGAMQERTSLTGECTTLKSNIEKLTTEQAKLRDSLQHSQRDCKELRTAKEELQGQRSELTTTCQDVKEQLESAHTENNRLVASNTALEREIATVTESAETANRELNSVRQSLQGQLAEVTATSQSLGSRVKSLEGTNRELGQAKSVLEREVASSQERANSLEEQLEAAGRDVARLTSDNETLNEMIGELQGDCDTLRAQAEAADAERTKLLATRQTLQACLADLSANAGESTSSPQDIQQIATLKARIQELESAAAETETLKTRIAELEAGTDESPTLQARTVELEAAYSQVTSLQGRIAELESGQGQSTPELAAANQQIVTLQSRIAELESDDTDLAPLHERITELEMALENAARVSAATVSPATTGTGITTGTASTSPAVTRMIVRDLAVHTKSASGIASGLQRPKLDDQQKQMLCGAAASLATHLDVLRTTFELAQTDSTLELTSAPTCPAETMQSIIEGVCGSASSKGIRLNQRIDAAVPASIVTDGTRLQQLLAWGMTFMTRHAAEGEISIIVSPTREGRELSFNLISNGVGLSADEVTAIVDGSVEEVGKFGRIAEALGGSLKVDNAGKQGFAVRISVATHQVDDKTSDRRSANRVYQELLQCNLGPVVDLTAGGVRVISNKGLKGRVNVELPTPDGTLKLRGYVVWSNRFERKQFEVGLRFVDILPEQAEQVLAIARVHGLAAAG